MFSSLANYNFRLFWSAQVISLTGTWMQTVGFAWLVLTLTHRADQLGLVTMLQFLPILLFALVGGVVADRVPKRSFLLLTQTVALLQALALGWLVQHHNIHLWEIYLLAVIGGLNAAFDNPTRQAFVVELVGRSDLANAVALNSGLFNLARIIGPAVGGWVIGTGTLERISITFYCNSASYIPALIALALMNPALFRAIGRPPQGRMLAQMVEAWKFCFRKATTTLIIVLMGIIGIFGYNFSVTSPLLAVDLHAGAKGFGTLNACMGCGSLLAAIYMARRRFFTRRLIVSGAAGFALFLGLAGASAVFPLTCGLFVCVGMASILGNTSSNTLLQMETPDELRGRVMSIYFLLLAGSTPIGGYITGVLAQHYHIRPTVGLEAAIVGVGVLWAALYYRTQGLQRMDQAARREAEGPPPAAHEEPVVKAGA